uniref:Long-chain-fatty-acid--CoA ligase n=1 Tax=uncultured bacterium esnapd22 TaxID=1366604 RepID=S5UBY1_9BACT|nr:long-chain-fatty-acid--CoA ligase [uncultured bacterium esnapd22]
MPTDTGHAHDAAAAHALDSAGADGGAWSLPLSFGQSRLWFLDRVGQAGVAYNLPAVFRLRGDVDAGALRRALGGIMARHEVLRTTIGVEDGEGVQLVHETFPLPWSMETVRGADAVRERVRRELHAPFDLSRGPLWRALLLDAGGGEHVLVLTLHHLVTDGWSMGVLFRELEALYAAERAGEDAELPELPIQYGDYAVWQRERLRGDVLERELAYWRERLAGVDGGAEVAPDRPRPAQSSQAGAEVELPVSREVADALRRIGREEQATSFMVLLAAFQALLARYTGREDVIVGTPVAGRTHEDVHGLIGFFVNTVVLRTDLGGAPSFREAVRRARRAALGAYEHQEVPFEKLVETLHPERDAGRNPLFQAMFAMHGGAGAPLGLAGVEVEPIDQKLETTAFDLAASLTEEGDGLGIVLTYATELFERATAERLAGHLALLLREVAKDPDRPLAELELLTGDDRRRVLHDWNRTDAPETGPLCIHTLFEAAVERAPDATAAVFQGESISYAELNRRANRLAHALRARGVGPEVAVGISVERSPEMLAGVLGILKAGGAYVPLDPGYPPERLRFMLADSGAALLLTQARLVARLPEHAAEVMLLDGADAAAGGWDEGNPRSGVRPENLAYVIYTSGSTGRPKGALMAHRGAVNVAHTLTAVFGVRAHSRMLQFPPLSFDASVSELVMAWAAGAALVLAPREELLPGPGLARLLRDERITHVTVPPSALAVMDPEAFPHLHSITATGERLPPAVVERWTTADRHIFNGYGPTEVTVGATVHRCEGPYDGSIPIGRPFLNTRVYLLARPCAPCRRGCRGRSSWRAWAFRAATCTARGSRPSASSPIPSPPSPAGGCTARGTGRGGCRPASWTSWGAWTSR